MATSSSDFDLYQEINKYKPLRTAIELGKWESAEQILNDDENALTGKLDENGSTALHMAVRNLDNTTFLDNLLNHIKEKKMPLLELLDISNFTVLQEAVMFDNIYAVKKLVDKEKRLLYRARYADELPLMSAAISATDDAYDLLNDHYDELSKAKELLPGDTLSYLAEKPRAYPSITTSYYFWQRYLYSCLPVENYSLDSRRKTADIENQEIKRDNRVAWKSHIYPVMERIYVIFWRAVWITVLRPVPYLKYLREVKVKHNKALTMLKFICEKYGSDQDYGNDDFKVYEKALFLTIENDIPEVIENITREFPQSIRTLKDDAYSLYELSIKNRSGKAYNFLAQKVADRKYLHHDVSKLLLLVGNLATQERLNMVSGAALQMQMEFRWFKEICKLVEPDKKKDDQEKNKLLVPGKEKDDQNRIIRETPLNLFNREHEDLRQKGEDWMKKTADSYTITAALIITIVFAAAITVPGGNNGETGKAIYKTRASFIVFIISDAISFFTSTTSLLLFLSILTARYEHEDFLYKLPKRLIFGLVMLFMSVTTMLIAFSAALYIMSGQENRWILVPITAITWLPIVSFVTLQLPLLDDLISSTYGNRIFGKRRA